MNTLKTMVLLTVLTLLFVFIGRVLGGQTGMITAFLLACVMNFVSYWFSDKIVLALYRAKEVSRAEAPELVEIVQELAMKANIPMPRVYIIPQESPNAFATGRNPQHAAVAVTQGILRILDRGELSGVLAHELAHVLHRDILISSIAATIAGAISMLASMARWNLILGGGRRDRNEGSNPIVLLIALILAPLAALLVQLSISRSREYDADKGGAQLWGRPLDLAHALQKLEKTTARIPMAAEPATAHMFIVNPLSAKGLMHLFSTHPPLEERIKRLEAMQV